MNVVEWTKDMSVGSEVLDGHHQMIIDCLKRLQPLIGSTGHDDEVNAVLAKLEDFVLVHFSEEEQAMKKAGYPDWRRHKELHDRMYDIVFNLKSDVEHGRNIDAARLHELIYNWLIQHILGEDRQYIPYLEHPAPESAGLWTRASGRPY
ncbi:MAG: bacteriohemerythrin [Azospirillaceae bacterium]|nr:bacteriohemerythrin [Azospirillaceae bacterium]